MFILLLSRDIPRYWELIKFVVVTVDEVDVAQRPAYLNVLLQDLLSDKAQCWVRTDGDQIVFVAVTRFLQNEQLDEKYLQIQAGYSWRTLDMGVWQRDLEILTSFAKREGCKYIGCGSRNPRLWERALGAGMQEVTRIFAYRV